MGIARSTAYYKPRGSFGPDPEEVRIKNAIDRIWTNHPCYGYRRIRISLRDQGIKIGKKLLVRYLREMGIATIYPGPNLSRRNKQHRTYPYLLRNVDIKHPNHVWGIDLTYVGMDKGFMYLALIIDWDSRIVVGHALSNTLHASFVVDCVRQAIAQHGKPLIMNSDQGAQFTSDSYIDLLKEQQIQISMNGKGRANDNAITERFIRSLKQECLYLTEIEDGIQLRRIIAEYINDYNWHRPHQSLGYRTPAAAYYVPSLSREAI